MFGRMSFVNGDPGRIDDLITYVRTVVKPATDELAGNHGLGMWVNRSTGECLVMTVWDDEATLRASEDAVLKLRDDAAGIIGGDAMVERYEARLIDTTEAHQPGNIMRLVRMSSDAASLDTQLDWVRTTVLPTISKLEGYLTYVAMADRATGAMASMSTFRDSLCADAAMIAMAPIREAAGERGVDITNICDFDVAIVGIRGSAPLTVDLTEGAKATADR